MVTGGVDLICEPPVKRIGVAAGRIVTGRGRGVAQCPHEPSRKDFRTWARLRLGAPDLTPKLAVLTVERGSQLARRRTDRVSFLACILREDDVPTPHIVPDARQGTIGRRKRRA